MKKQRKLERYENQYEDKNMVITIEDGRVEVSLFEGGECVFNQTTTFCWECFDEELQEGAFESTDYHPNSTDFLDNISEPTLSKLWKAIINNCKAKINNK